MTSSYVPPFDDPGVLHVVARRGLLAEHETIKQGIDRVVGALAAVDSRLSPERSDRFHSELSRALHSGCVAVSSQLFAAAGRPGQVVAACTVLPVAGTCDESRLRRVIIEATISSELGMGCGIDVSDFDDPAAALRSINAALTVVHRDLCGRNLRPPALMVTCKGSHPGVADFIEAKRHADFTEWVANISVRLTSDVEYASLRGLLAAGAHRNGEPGILFQDVADADNPTPSIELSSTAPCAEVFLAAGERCVFVTVNLAAHVDGSTFDWDTFADSVRTATRAADAAVELAVCDASPIVAARRRIGIGVCGYHTALIDLGVPYAESIKFAGRVAEQLTFAAHSASAQLAAERGPFPLFEGSRWTDRRWISRKAHRRQGFIPTSEWGALEDQILVGGIRNAAVVAYPPTGVVAELLGVSRSYEPHFTLAGRTGVASRRTAALAPEVDRYLGAAADGIDARSAILDPATGYQVPGAGPSDVLACARQLPAAVHLAVHSAFTGIADEAGSKTVNLPQNTTVAEVAELIDDARALGLKGLTVFRDGCLDENSRPAS